ncbi:12257_t:CDS:2 [Dentiscutata erythropus]|uniref:12257_t:CDS:1 n=1 Tax=Dentiscutata erythropus TaxID=1348616 RepID=A0A9N9DSK8_9GLOM|nr:12257_t:CDS:2 [Dentiscutata erythropus]
MAHKINLILIYINVEEEEDMCIKNVDKCEELMQQSANSNKDKAMAERGKDVISKNVGNNERKAFKEDPKPDAPNCGISLINIFWNNIRSGNSNQVGLKKENAEENDIVSNESISEINDRGLDDLEAKEEMTSNEKDEHKKFVYYFDKSDQINERESKNIFDAFIEEDLIDFGCVAEESVINNNSRGVNNAGIEKVDKVANSLRNDNSEEFKCGMNLCKWYWHTNFEGLEYGNKEGNSVIKNENEIEVKKMKLLMMIMTGLW